MAQRTAVEAAIEFLENDHARDLLGLAKIRVSPSGEMMERGEVAAALRAYVAPAARPDPPCPLDPVDRRDVEQFLEQWGIPIGTSHWRIGQTMAWKIAKYAAWLQVKAGVEAVS